MYASEKVTDPPQIHTAGRNSRFRLRGPGRDLPFVPQLHLSRHATALMHEMPKREQELRVPLWPAASLPLAELAPDVEQHDKSNEQQAKDQHRGRTTEKSRHDESQVKRERESSKGEITAEMRL